MKKKNDSKEKELANTAMGGKNLLSPQLLPVLHWHTTLAPPLQSRQMCTTQVN